MSPDGFPDVSDPERVQRATFDTQRKGFDKMQVTAFLTVVAAELRRLRELESTLRAQLATAEQRASTAEATAAELEGRVQAPPEITESLLTQYLGEETARVLATAREAASQRLAKAEADAAALEREAADEAREVRERAAAEAEATRRAADDHAETARRTASDEAGRLRREAAAEADQIRQSAHEAVEAEIEAARQRGREMLAEAQLVRERVLADLARRRRSMRSQIEQLRAGRDRLLASHESVRTLVDDIWRELDGALDEAAASSQRAARRVASEPETTAAEIEAEISAARVAGLPIVDPDDVAAAAERLRASGDRHEIVEEPEPTGEVDLRTVRAELTGEVPVVAESVAEPPAPAEPAPPEAEPAAEPPAPSEPEPAAEPEPEATAPEAPAEFELEPTVVVAEPEPASEPATEPDAPEPADTEDFEVVPPPPPPAPPASAPEAPPAPEPEPEPEPAPAPATATAPAENAPPEPDEPATGVDDLFARIRRSRARSVAQAHEVLGATTETSAGSEAAPASERRRPAFLRPEPELAVLRPSPTGPTGPDASQGDTTASGAAPAGAAGDHATTGAPAPAADAAVDEVGVEAEADPDQRLLVEADALLEPLESVVARKLKRVLADEQNDAQDQLRRSKAIMSLDDLFSPVDEQVQHYLVAVEAELADAARRILPLAGIDDAAAGSGDGDDAWTANAGGALAWSVSVSLVTPVRERLRRVLAEVAEPTERVDRVRAVYRDAKAQRIEPLARELVRLVANRSVADHAPGLVRWVVDPVAGCSPDCVDNSLADDVRAGDEFPTGVTQPPAHADCRCLLVSVRQ